MVPGSTDSNLQAAPSQNLPPKENDPCLYLTFQALDALYKPALTTDHQIASCFILTPVPDESKKQ